MKKTMLIFLLLIQITFCQTLYSKELPKVGRKDEEKMKYYEFKELTIKVKIQEPEVLFILDKPYVMVEPFEENLTFIDKIDEPLLKDNLF